RFAVTVTDTQRRRPVIMSRAVHEPGTLLHGVRTAAAPVVAGEASDNLSSSRHHPTSPRSCSANASRSAIWTRRRLPSLTDRNVPLRICSLTKRSLTGSLMATAGTSRSRTSLDIATGALLDPQHVEQAT